MRSFLYFSVVGNAYQAKGCGHDVLALGDCSRDNVDDDHDDDDHDDDDQGHCHYKQENLQVAAYMNKYELWQNLTVFEAIKAGYTARQSRTVRQEP